MISLIEFSYEYQVEPPAPDRPPPAGCRVSELRRHRTRRQLEAVPPPVPRFEGLDVVQTQVGVVQNAADYHHLGPAFGETQFRFNCESHWIAFLPCTFEQAACPLVQVSQFLHTKFQQVNL